jgi:hypothetical protein
MAELTVPSMDFSTLGNLGKIYKEAQNEQGLKDAFSQGVGNDPQSLAALAQKVAPYNPQLGINLAQLAHTYTRQGMQDTRQAAQDARQGGLDEFNRKMELEALALKKAEDARRAKAADEDEYVVKEVDNDGVKTLVRVRKKGNEGAIDTGLAATQPGNPFSAGGKFNEGQGKAAGFADRMLQSEGVLTGSGPGEGFEGPASPGVQEEGAGRVQASLSAVPFAGNYLTTPERKSYEQAKRTFINSQLRRESGATIQDAEFLNADKQYFPQPGDDAGTIAQKAAIRRNAIEAMGREGGPSYRPQQTYDRHGKIAPYAKRTTGPTGPTRQVSQEQAPQPAPQDGQGFRAAPRVGELRDGYRFKGGNPGDPASWVKQNNFNDRFGAAFSGDR